MRTAMATLPWMLAIFLSGCHSAQPAPLGDKEDADPASQHDEGRGVAEAALGKQAEILAHGDLAKNGGEQLLVVNRVSKETPGGAGSASASPIFVTRAAILEKQGAKWSEILRCDEYLKNSNGYLGGSPLTRVSSWRLQFQQDGRKGLELRFTPADPDSEGRGPGKTEAAGKTVFVSWNNKVKRYQSLDQSHERYLNEAPSLGPAESILK